METFLQIPGLPIVLNVQGVDVPTVMNAVQKLRHDQGPRSERIFHGFGVGVLVDFSQVAACSATNECPDSANVVKVMPGSLGL